MVFCHPPCPESARHIQWKTGGEKVLDVDREGVPHTPLSSLKAQFQGAKKPPDGAVCGKVLPGLSLLGLGFARGSFFFSFQVSRPAFPLFHFVILFAHKESLHYRHTSVV
jgi:hypothetical protein